MVSSISNSELAQNGIQQCPFLPQIVPLPPSIITNRYVVSTIPRPNYQRQPLGQPSYSSALAAPAPKQITPYTIEDPFGPIQTQKPSSSFSSGKERSPYVEKPFVQHISYIEPHLVHIKDPLALAMEVLPEGWHFLPKHLGKNIKFYKSILIQEKSACVENIMNKKGDPSVVLYYKFIITGFTSCQDWGHPSILKQLTDYKGSELYYSYYDHMDAFEKVLFFQNKNYDHSWFLMFDKKFFSIIPSWFLKWWEMFDPIPQILPKPLQDALRYFSSRHNASVHGSQFPTILHMTVMYRIHWISTWNYTINNNLLDREFLVKWWDSLRINQIIDQVHKDFPPLIQKAIAHRTRSRSSLDFVQISGKSSKELRDLGQQLILQSEQLESAKKNSPASSEASVGNYPNNPLFQDSQDPYNGCNLDSD